MKKRTLAWLLSLAMVLSLAPTAMAVESSQGKTTPNPSEQGEDVEVVYEVSEFQGSWVTTAEPGIATYALGSVQATDGNYEKWIDRIDLEGDAAFAKTFYNALAECLVKDDSFDPEAQSKTYDSADVGNVIKVSETSTGIVAAKIENVSSTEASNIATNAAKYVQAALDAFDRDHPEVFWLGNSYQYTVSKPSSGIGTVGIVLILGDTTKAADLRAEAYQAEGAISSAISERDRAVDKILSDKDLSVSSKPSTEADQYAAVQALNDWLTKNNEYNTTVSGNPSVDGPALAYECLSALKGSTGNDGPVCEGYARAFKVLCDKLEIPCVLVDGLGDGGAHMWNYVQMEDDLWYAVDVTWNDPIGGASGKESGFESEDYLLVGSDTKIPNESTGTAFSESHTVQNIASNGGHEFTNGPVLSKTAYVPETTSSGAVTFNGSKAIVYDGAEVSAAEEKGDNPQADITYKLADSTGTPEPELTAKWYTRTGEGEDAVRTAFSDGDLNAPKNVGSYALGVTVGDETEAEVYYFDFDITPATLTVESVTVSGADKTYDKTPALPANAAITVTFNEPGKNELKAGDDQDYTVTAVFADANAGTDKELTYTITLKDTAIIKNYTVGGADGEAVNTITGTADTKATITAQELESISVILTGADNLTFTGEAHEPSVTTVTGTLKGGSETVTLETTDYTVSYEDNIDAGEERAKVIVTAKTGGNYTWGTPATKTFTIKQAAAITVEPVTITCPVAEGADLNKTYSLAAALGDVWTKGKVTAGTVVVEDTNDPTIIEGAPTIEVTEGQDVTLKYTLAEDVDADKTAALTVTIESQNYKEVTIAVTIKTSNKLERTLTLTADKTTVKFGETVTLTADRTAGDEAAIEYTQSGDGEVGIESTETGATLTTTQAGTVVVTGTIAEDSTYIAASASVTIKIEKADALENGTVTIEVPAETTGEQTYTLSNESDSAVLAALTELKTNNETISAVVAVTEDNSHIISATPTFSLGTNTLTYTLTGVPAENDEVKLTITVSSTNYEDYTITVTITVTESTSSDGHTHVWSETEWDYDETHHWHKCTGTGECDPSDPSDIEESGYAEHVWGSGEVTTQPTTSTTGVKLYTCSVCGGTKEETIPKLNDSTGTGGDQNTNTGTGSTGGGYYGGGSGSSSSGTSSSATVAEPSTSGGSTTVEMTTGSTTSGTTASADIKTADMNKAVNTAIAEAAKQGTAPVVEVEVKTSSRANSLNVTLPTSSLETLANTRGSSLVITSDVATVALDHTALSALADQAHNSTVSLQVAPVTTSALTSTQQTVVGTAQVVDLTLVSGRTVISDYNNGTITVTLPYDLPSGVSARDVVVYYLADNGTLTPCSTRYSGGKVTFTTNHLSKYVIAGAELADRRPATVFYDVPANAYYYDAVQWAVENGVTEGLGNNTFGPNTTCTRAQIVTFLWRAKGKPAPSTRVNPFTDVAAGSYYYDAVLWAVENGITTGTGDGSTFDPNGACTRAQIVTFLWRANRQPTVNAASVFNDVAAGSYYADAVAWAVAKGITTGDGDSTTFNPNGECTRAQCVTFLYRAK